MKIIEAEEGKFMETLRQHAGTDTAVLPHGTNYPKDVTGAAAFEALLRHPAPHPLDLSLECV